MEYLRDIFELAAIIECHVHDRRQVVYLPPAWHMIHPAPFDQEGRGNLEIADSTRTRCRLRLWVLGQEAMQRCP